MIPNVVPGNLGQPDLKFGDFELWVHRRQFPEAADFDDGNWLLVTVHCVSSGASVWANGAFLMVVDIIRFGEECKRLLNGETSTASLDPLEPELSLKIDSIDRLGHLMVEVKITPDHRRESHTMAFEIDQSYLSGIIAQCAVIAHAYPVLGKPA